MSFVKFIALLSAVFVLLPAESGQQERLWKQSIDIANWAITTCDRQPQSCETVKQAWSKFTEKSTKSAALFTDTVIAKLPAISFSQMTKYAIDYDSAINAQATQTLRAEDLVPQWRGDLSTAY